MASKENIVLKFAHLSDLLSRLKLPVARHPLICIVDYAKVEPNLSDAGSFFLLGFYKISFKTSYSGIIPYGPSKYDFRDGGLAFLSPDQIVQMPYEREQYEGYVLYFHPDLLLGHDLARRIRRYGFFSYAVAEALFLSDIEKRTISKLFETIEEELNRPIDAFSQDVFVSQIALLLQYSNRFYNRQFITRKPELTDTIDGFQEILQTHFEVDRHLYQGIPSPQDIAGKLGVSKRYLADMLKALTGKTTRQHIQLKLVETAKELLATTSLTTAEIAYRLGFEHPQSFNKFFKQKTDLFPRNFRENLN